VTGEHLDASLGTPQKVGGSGFEKKRKNRTNERVDKSSNTAAGEVPGTGNEKSSEVRHFSHVRKGKKISQRKGRGKEEGSPKERELCT